jgi:hypothetical protein
MKHLRLVLATAALAAALANPRPAEASGGCPSIISAGHPYYSCGYRSGTCPNCKYECSDGEFYTWDTCTVE